MVWCFECTGCGKCKRAHERRDKVLNVMPTVSCPRCGAVLKPGQLACEACGKRYGIVRQSKRR